MRGERKLSGFLILNGGLSGRSLKQDGGVAFVGYRERLTRNSRRSRVKSAHKQKTTATEPWGPYSKDPTI